MNDEILQHHFDEVFSALQDKENFEIFTGMKKVSTPRVKKTLVKIMPSPSRPETVQTPPGVTPTNVSKTSMDSGSITTYSVVSKSGRDRTNSFSQSQQEPSIAGKLYFMPSHEERKQIANRNTLFECKHCGRYVLGQFLAGHESKCGDESMSNTAG